MAERWTPKAAAARLHFAVTRSQMELGETPEPVSFDDLQVLLELLLLLCREGWQLRLEVATAPFGELGGLSQVIHALLVSLVVVAHQQPPREREVRHLDRESNDDGKKESADSEK
jgi:hypothetical protein